MHHLLTGQFIEGDLSPLYVRSCRTPEKAVRQISFPYKKQSMKAIQLHGALKVRRSSQAQATLQSKQCSAREQCCDDGGR
eukprot:3899817-Pleurochrysis_carterae.AAC.1